MFAHESIDSSLILEHAIGEGVFLLQRRRLLIDHVFIHVHAIATLLLLRFMKEQNIVRIRHLADKLLTEALRIDGAKAARVIHAQTNQRQIQAVEHVDIISPIFRVSFSMLAPRPDYHGVHAVLQIRRHALGIRAFELGRVRQRHLLKLERSRRSQGDGRRAPEWRAIRILRITSHFEHANLLLLRLAFNQRRHHARSRLRHVKSLRALGWLH